MRDVTIVYYVTRYENTGQRRPASRPLLLSRDRGAPTTPPPPGAPPRAPGPGDRGPAPKAWGESRCRRRRQGRGTGREVALRAQKETPRTRRGDGFVSGLPLVAGPLTAARDCAPTDCARACARAIACRPVPPGRGSAAGLRPRDCSFGGLPTPAHAQPSVPPVGRAVPCPLPGGCRRFASLTASRAVFRTAACLSGRSLYGVSYASDITLFHGSLLRDRYQPRQRYVTPESVSLRPCFRSILRCVPASYAHSLARPQFSRPRRG